MGLILCEGEGQDSNPESPHENKQISQEDLVKKNKLIACLNLSKSRITKDEFFVDEFVDLMIIRTGGEKKEKTDKLISMILLTCYERINESQVKPLASLSAEEIDPFTDENKGLLQMERWKDLYEDPNKAEMLNKQLKSLSSALKDVQNDEIQDLFKDDTLNQENEEDSNKITSYGLFGIDLKSISETTKNIIGFSFLALLFVLAFFALKAIQKPEKIKIKKNKPKSN